LSTGLSLRACERTPNKDKLYENLNEENGPKELMMN
jgi:hypothetical protein